MNVRTGAPGLFALAFLAGGCAGGGAPGAVAPQAVADEDLPAWVLALPEGELARDNDHTATASLFLAQGAYDQAVESAQAGMQLDPTNPQSFLQAGQAYVGLGDLEAADEMFDQVEVLSPRAVLEVNFYRETEWIDGFNAAVGAMQAGDAGGALAAFERAHTIYQGRPEAMVQLGALYQQDGRLDDAPPGAWERLRALAGSPDGVVLRLGIPATRIAAAIEAARGLRATAWGHVAAGSVVVHAPAIDVTSVRVLRRNVEAEGGFLIVESGPPALRAVVDPLGAATVALVRSLKQQFDPAGTLSPGRWEPGL